MTQPTETPPSLGVYSIITDHVTSLLQQQSVPWFIPWVHREPPRNLISQRPYRGINVWLLASSKYEKSLFLSWDQLKAVGGSVKKGEQGYIAVTSNKFVADQGGKQVPLLRYYKVFNVAQCTGIPSSLMPQSQPSGIDPFIAGDEVIKNMQSPPLRRLKETPSYDVISDCIKIPRKGKIAFVPNYYRIYFRKLIHSTGHASRLNRPTIAGLPEYGTDPYGMEACVAELGAHYLCSLCGIEHPDPTYDQSYLEGWTGVLAQDTQFFFTASVYAQRAVDYILGSPPGQDAKQETEGLVNQEVE